MTAWWRWCTRFLTNICIQSNEPSMIQSYLVLRALFTRTGHEEHRLTLQALLFDFYHTTVASQRWQRLPEYFRMPYLSGSAGSRRLSAIRIFLQTAAAWGLYPPFSDVAAHSSASPVPSHGVFLGDAIRALLQPDRSIPAEVHAARSDFYAEWLLFFLRITTAGLPAWEKRRRTGWSMLRFEERAIESLQSLILWRRKGIVQVCWTIHRDQHKVWSPRAARRADRWSVQWTSIKKLSQRSSKTDTQMQLLGEQTYCRHYNSTGKFATSEEEQNVEIMAINNEQI